MRLEPIGLFKLIFFTVFFCALVVAWLGFGQRGFVHLYRMDTEKQNYIDRIRKLESENSALLDEIDRLLKDNDYIESVVRRELGFVKDGEVLYRFAQQEDEMVFGDRTEETR